ncbi:helix-turn-helix domain-containing protein [Mucilaginibacter sp.]|uniref:helix-turn-helix domain-containing protein n=1 Tax=Mucilaginibacter sp. TaxID=1882438 RepID=UPI0035BC3CDC
MQLQVTANTSIRQQDITAKFIAELDKHLADLKAGLLDKSMEINDFADLLFITPAHLSDTIKDVLGKSPCDVYEEGMVRISKELLLDTAKSIGEIAVTLTYDPSNFTKFFKRYAGMKPKEYRNQHAGKLKPEQSLVA